MASFPPPSGQQSKATPCLDRQLPFPARSQADSQLRWWQLTMIAALLLFKTFFVLICVWMSLVLIHELGHVAGALIVGFRFNFIRIGPFQIDRSRKISWHWTWRALLNGMTGAGAVSRSKLRWRFCAYIVAGPVTNLVVAFCAFKIMPRNDSMGAAVGLAIFRFDIHGSH
jgi:hypothetical protein